MESYDYRAQKACLGDPVAMMKLMNVFATAQRLIREAGCARATAITRGVVGDSWDTAALVDFLVEAGYLREVKLAQQPALQDRIFTEGERFPEDGR